MSNRNPPIISAIVNHFYFIYALFFSFSILSFDFHSPNSTWEIVIILKKLPHTSSHIKCCKKEAKCEDKCWNYCGDKLSMRRDEIDIPNLFGSYTCHIIWKTDNKFPNCIPKEPFDKADSTQNAVRRHFYNTHERAEYKRRDENRSGLSMSKSVEVKRIRKELD